MKYQTNWSLMKMVPKKNRNNKGIKKLSDYIVTFAFLYSAFLCFDKSNDLWNSNRLLTIILLVCGTFSFIAVFRFFSKTNILFNEKEEKMENNKNFVKCHGCKFFLLLIVKINLMDVKLMVLYQKIFPRLLFLSIWHKMCL